MTPVEIMAMVAKTCGVTTEQMLLRGKQDEIVFARYITIMLLMEEGYKNKDILALFPAHSKITILYNSKYSFNDLISYHIQFRRLYQRCLRKLLIATGELETL